MPILQRNELPHFGRGIAGLQRFLRQYPRVAGNTAVNFFKDRFARQGWQDTAFQRWQPRKLADRGRNRGTRALLVQSDRLKRGIRIHEATWGRVVVANDVPYARAHNEGATGTVSQRVRAHTVRSHSRRQGTRRVQVREHSREAHARTIQMALPRRQFMGNSQLLNRRIQSQINTTLKDLENTIFGNG